MSIQDLSGGDQNVDLTLDSMKSVAKEEMQELYAEQQDSQESFIQSQEEAVNPFAQKMATKQKEVKTHKSRVQKMMEAGSVKALLPVEKIKESAEKFQKRNPELRANVLAALREQIKPGDTKEDILRKLAEFYPDATLADEALEFLLETSEGELTETLNDAKQDFEQANARQIAAGKNMGAQALKASENGLGSPTSLREVYRDITGNPRDSPTLFEELSNKYAFKDLKKVIDFLLHSLGADMKAKGPSIPRGMLHRLFTETRSLQAILGVYRFFKSRMPLIEKQFSKEDLKLPSQLTFENLSKQFMGLASDRYPSAGKVLQRSVTLGIEKWISAKIIAFTQMRDAIRQVAINQVYKSVQHRDDLYMAILEALEDLEDELEDLIDSTQDEDEDEEESKNKNDPKDTLE